MKKIMLDQMILTTCCPTNAGSKMLDGYMSLFDATVKEKLTEAGYEIGFAQFALSQKQPRAALLAEITGGGFHGGKLRISHCQNGESAEALAELALAAYPGSDIEIIPTTALCSFYAERGGLIIAFEGA